MSKSILSCPLLSKEKPTRQELSDKFTEIENQTLDSDKKPDNRLTNNSKILRTEEYQSIYFAIFFDGTKNNSLNRNFADANQRKLKEAYNDDKKFYDSSFTNGHTNIYYLYNLLEPKSRVCSSFIKDKIYVTGVGTDENRFIDKIDDVKFDATVGLASGKGNVIPHFGSQTGIHDKINEAFRKIFERISKPKFEVERVILEEKPDDIELKLEITFDVFGFSRGSTTARYFCELIKSNFLKLIPKDNPLYEHKKNITTEINFIGIFDTVVSYASFPSIDIKNKEIDWGTIDIKDRDFSDATDTLFLNATEYANFCLHICAADEFRYAFSLTKISNKTHGAELFLPGCHADLGGGYREYSFYKKLKKSKTDEITRYKNESSKEKQTSFLTEKYNFFGSEIKYQTNLETSSDITLIHPISEENSGFLKQLYSEIKSTSEKPLVSLLGGCGSSIYGRKLISNSYQHVSKNLMRNGAVQKGFVPFRLSSNIIIDPFANAEDLVWQKDLITKIEVYFQNILNNSTRAGCKDWFEKGVMYDSNQKSINKLREKYVHWSSEFEKGENVPRITDNGFERKVFNES